MQGYQIMIGKFKNHIRIIFLFNRDSKTQEKNLKLATKNMLTSGVIE